MCFLHLLHDHFTQLRVFKHRVDHGGQVLLIAFCRPVQIVETLRFDQRAHFRGALGQELVVEVDILRITCQCELHVFCAGLDAVECITRQGIAGSIYHATAAQCGCSQYGQDC